MKRFKLVSIIMAAAMVIGGITATPVRAATSEGSWKNHVKGETKVVVNYSDGEKVPVSLKDIEIFDSVWALGRFYKDSVYTDENGEVVFWQIPGTARLHCVLPDEWAEHVEPLNGVGEWFKDTVFQIDFDQELQTETAKGKSTYYFEIGSAYLGIRHESTFNFQAKKYYVGFFVDGEETDYDVVEYLRTSKKVLEPKKDGYKFVGWFNKDKEDELFIPGATQVTDHIDVYAKFEPLVCKVTFKGMNDSVIKEKEVPYGETALSKNDVLLVPSVDGYKFTDKWLKNDVEFDLSTPITKDTVLVAKYDKIDNGGGNNQNPGGGNDTPTPTTPPTPPAPPTPPDNNGGNNDNPEPVNNGGNNDPQDNITNTPFIEPIVETTTVDVIRDEETPLASVVEEIDDEEVVLSAGDSDEESLDDMIDDEETPLSALPKTGNLANVVGTISVASVVTAFGGLAALKLLENKNKKTK